MSTSHDLITWIPLISSAVSISTGVLTLGRALFGWLAKPAALPPMPPALPALPPTAKARKRRRSRR